jgi:hypothetical protein
LSLLRDVLTGPDGKTYCTSSVAFYSTLSVFLVLAILNREKFDPQTFGIGVASVIAAYGAAKRLEPKEMYGPSNDSSRSTDQ